MMFSASLSLWEPDGSPAGALPASTVATTKAFRWRKRLWHDAISLLAGVLTFALPTTGFFLSKQLDISATSVVILALPTFTILAVRASFLFPNRSERLNSEIQTIRLEEDRAFVAKYWLNPKNRQVLRQFIAAFDASEFALRKVITDTLSTFGDAMPLNQKLSYALESGVWASNDVKLWENCLAIQQEILLNKRTDLSSSSLSGLSKRLEELAARTDSTSNVA
jgi:hypothetical protein